MVSHKGGFGLSIYFRVLLLIVSVGAILFVLRKIRKSQVQIDDTVFWIIFMLGLVLSSIFPNIVIMISNLIGVESPANFVFLCIIFLLLLRVFILSLQISKMKYQIQQLTQIVAQHNFHKDIDKDASQANLKGMRE